MRHESVTRARGRGRARYAQLSVPAAVAGAIAGAFAAVPADAASAPVGQSHHGALPSAAHRALHALRVPTAASATYTVQAGDTVWSIAQRFRLRTADVLAWNGLSSDAVIHPGQTLHLTGPGSGAPAPAAPTPAASATHVVVAGDTVFGIARSHGTTVAAILAANGLNGSSIIYPGQTLQVPGAAPASAPVTPAAAPTASMATGITHTVVAGDTIFGLAQRHGTTVAAVLAANGLSAASIIYPGQSIVVPTATSAGVAPAAAPAAAAQPQSAALDAEQAENARLIIRIGRELGVPDRGIAIALATSMVESWIRNLDWGDRDSLGLFQQRPSTGWGTPEQIRDRERSIRVFFGGPGDPNGTATRGLLDFPGWEGMSFSEAAQRVQISAYPERYGQWEAQAYQWLALYG